MVIPMVIPMAIDIDSHTSRLYIAIIRDQVFYCMKDRLYFNYTFTGGGKQMDVHGLMASIHVKLNGGSLAFLTVDFHFPVMGLNYVLDYRHAKPRTAQLT